MINTYKNRLQFKVLILFVLVQAIVKVVNAQDSTGYYRKMDSLQAQYRAGAMVDTIYMQAVNNVAEKGYGLSGFYQSLQFFRHLAFSKKDFGKYRMVYYRHLSIEASSTNRTGRSIYYLEKEIKEAQLLQPNRRRDFAMASFMIGTYLNASLYDKCMAEYKKILPALQKVPDLVITDSIDRSSADHALMVLVYIMPVLEKLKDSAAMKQAGDLATSIYNNLSQQKNPLYQELLLIYKYSYHTIQFWYHKFFSAASPGLVVYHLNEMRNTLLSPDYGKTRDTNKNAYLVPELYMRIANYYIDVKNVDSALHYLQLQQELTKNAAEPLLNKLEYNETMSKISVVKGDYQEAYHFMKNAFDELASTLQHTIIDKDNNLYAQAQAEDQKEELSEVEKQKQVSEGKLKLSFAGIALLLIVTVVIVLFIKQRQEKKYLEFKLNMARSLHDETGPALLYANALIKKYAPDDSKVKNELEQQINHTVEVIRNLSHDLRSDKQHTVGVLMAEIDQVLKKLSAATHFKYSIQLKNVENKFLSHFQYANIKAILNECITNSVKHASFSKIKIAVHVHGKKIYLTYSDNGEGWDDTSAKKNGIGSQNIRERIEKLRGEIEVQNNYPNGYNIGLIIPQL